MSSEQKAQLKKRGKLFKLSEVDPDLMSRIENIKPDDNIFELAEELITKFKDYTIVQPAGSPQFQAVLGMLSYIYNVELFYAVVSRKHNKTKDTYTLTHVRWEKIKYSRKNKKPTKTKKLWKRLF